MTNQRIRKVNPKTAKDSIEKLQRLNRTVAMLKRVSKTGGKVIVTERGSTATYVMTIDFVGTRWFKGTIRCFSNTRENNIAYTATFGDILTTDVRIEEVVD